MKRWRARISALLLVLILVLVTWDLIRPPQSQWMSRVYIRWVVVYQTHYRGTLKDSIQCRYIPSCSEYSIVAVGQHGLVRGLILTVRRLASCQASVPENTPDPVPS